MDNLEASGQGGEFWVSVSDLMSGLMVVFMFIAVAYITNLAVEYKELKTELYEDLAEEFEEDLPQWGAELDSTTLSVRFKEPDILFDKGEARLKPRFRRILGDFFPRYVKVLRQEKYAEDIEEVRIEGHTSSEWTEGVYGRDAYIANMELSQGRTRSVFKYVMDLEPVREDTDWLIERLTANGLSSSHLIYDETGQEDKERSRRVEFRVRTDAETRIGSVIAEGR